MTRVDVIINARQLMGLSQSRLAESIGISTKAVQSYEQGWRTVPNRVFSQLFVLLADVGKQTSCLQPCRQMKDCERIDCAVGQSDSACFCWMRCANHCGMMNSDEHAAEADFMSCPVLAGLLYSE